MSTRSGSELLFFVGRTSKGAGVSGAASLTQRAASAVRLLVNSPCSTPLHFCSFFALKTSSCTCCALLEELSASGFFSQKAGGCVRFAASREREGLRRTIFTPLLSCSLPLCSLSLEQNAWLCDGRNSGELRSSAPRVSRCVLSALAGGEEGLPKGEERDASVKREGERVSLSLDTGVCVLVDAREAARHWFYFSQRDLSPHSVVSHLLCHRESESKSQSEEEECRLASLLRPWLEAPTAQWHCNPNNNNPTTNNRLRREAAAVGLCVTE